MRNQKKFKGNDEDMIISPLREHTPCNLTCATR